MHTPGHSSISRPDLAGEIAAEMLVGAEDDLLLPRDLAEDRLGADELVTITSLSAFTSVEQLM